ncbi:hypothetical protein ACIBBE_23795 [Streptomyces sp. NPDC051644]|uniref:hypothetical protein n=1 Tax=Streptomyces sp. NPDC051644 TaxID=3365666 RepID=UPI0037909E6B
MSTITGKAPMALVRSWLTGLPTGVVILSDRENPQWTGVNGDVYTTGTAKWAVVDGKQRLLTAQSWFTDNLAVPASWFAPNLIAETEQTEDGPYVRHSGLTRPGRLKFKHRAMLQVSEFKTAATLADEAVMFLLVNGGGTPQTDQDMQRALDIAHCL